QGLTATRLGIRSLSEDTPLSVLNDGRGVQIVTGATDPLTGLPDPAGDVDFAITLGDGRTIEVDLRPQDILTMGDLIARINAEAEALGIDVPGDFEAGLSDGANGIHLRQGETPGPITIEDRNGSLAAGQLGLLGGAY